MTVNKKTLNFVLVHGAFHGAWCWRSVTEQLRQAGHRVFTPTLTGLGERSHLASATVSLLTHVSDVEQVLEYEELNDVILVGHSYASYVIAGVADRRRDSIKRLVYLDSYLPKNGTNFFSNIPQTMLDELAADLIDGYLVPAFAPEFFGVLPADSPEWHWVNRHLSPQPVATFTEELNFSSALEDIPVDFIRCTLNIPPEGDSVSGEAKNMRGWNYHELASGHDAMVTMPEALGKLLLEIGA